MPDDRLLDRISIATPCPATWAGMKGDDRVRFCGLCDKHVYNISALTATEATALIVASEGNLCVQLYRRKDGTVLTSDCPVGLATRARRRLFRMASFAVVGVAAVLSGASRVSARLGEAAGSPRQFSFQEWYDWTLQKLGIATPPPPPTRGAMVLGGISIRHIPAANPSTESAEDY